ncbi:2-hydroxyacid dehydrogenase [Azospirillum agricola]|uniref:2-hydroxyacid dehydrogenase n=1 Tax=Azospirillum agricola TaxID=1720247 RepID=UPI000A0F3C45|nr:2-hydroxyacid dehydrogenase [Azospirillum agricola]SMH36173.1 Lactate dehydrogenase [Azospirillum lipoferum]
MNRSGIDILLSATMPPGVAEDLARHFTLHGPEVIGSPGFADLAPRIRGMASREPAKVDAALLEALPNLEIISSYSAGIDNIDLDAAKRRGLVVANSSEALDEEVADTAIALMLMSVRRFAAAQRHVLDGNWAKGPFPLSRSLKGKRLGIVGLGHIGEAIAVRAAVFGLSIAYHNRKPKPGAPYAYHATAVELAANSDILAVCCPGGPATLNLIDAKVLRALGPDGVVVNVSRGSVVDEDALLAALAEGSLAGAGLDVCRNEPNPRPELVGHPDIVLLPHVGSATTETRARMGHVMRDNLLAHFAAAHSAAKEV